MKMLESFQRSVWSVRGAYLSSVINGRTFYLHLHGRPYLCQVAAFIHVYAMLRGKDGNK